MSTCQTCGTEHEPWTVNFEKLKSTAEAVRNAEKRYAIDSSEAQESL